MAQLVLSIVDPKSGSNRPQEIHYLLQKRMTTVGTEPGHDVVVPSEFTGVVFTITDKGEAHEILPARGKLRLNGQTLSRSQKLQACDRIEWSGGTACYLSTPLAQLHSGLPARDRGPGIAAESSGSTAFPAPAPAATAGQILGTLQNIAFTLQISGGVQIALYQTLDSLIEMAHAEVGYLLTETANGAGWKMIASRQFDERGKGANRELAPTRREIFSNTILNEALRRREPVYVENIIGHPWAEAASVIEARIFSAACFPLLVGQEILGAVLLLTRSAGRVIRKESLGDLSLFATQAALMLASQTELSKTRKENAHLRSLVSDWPTSMIYGEGSPMAELERKIDKLARTPLGVLILGETGTGKEVIAREIHNRSERAKEPFVAVNCAAIPSTLLESTLFGYEKGAFTGATRSHPGKFTQADGGTLLLDEIGDLPAELQAKLLRVLQEKQVEPLGASQPLTVNVRILAATHQDLEAQVRSGRFRQDLFFRLNGSTLRLPPLRERVKDIRSLAEHFISKSGNAHKLTPDALRALEQHPWPGNVRELEQVITRAALLCDRPEIHEADLELGPSTTPLGAHSDAAEAATLWDGILDSTLQSAQLAFTRDFVQRVLKKHGQNRAEAALGLGISERTLYRILAETQADKKGRLS